MKSNEETNLSDQKMIKKLQMFTHVLENIYPSTKELIWKSFLKGIFIGLGTTIGVSIVLALLTYILTTLKVFPFFGALINNSRVEDILLKK